MMQTWLVPLTAALGGFVAALAAATGVAPWLAFAAGALVVLGVAAVARWVRPPDPVLVPEAPPRRAAAPPPEPTGRELLDALPSPLMIIAASGRVLRANRAAREALPRIEPDAHFAHVIRAPAFVEALSATLADGTERGSQFTAFGGGERIFEARVARLPVKGDSEPQAIVQIEDRTRTRRAEQLRSDFIANASHELRTPLASIIGYIETLQNHARQDPEAREKFLETMGREAARMQRLVDDLMSLSRIEMDEHLRPAERWSLAAIAADCAAALQPVAEMQGVRVEFEPGTDEMIVACDRDQLYQVFTNLIDNAIKYGGQGSTVTVGAAEQGGANPSRHGITVADNGPGIAREHLHRLTERFYRVNVGHSRNKGGTGLGLAIVKHILNRHRGRLEIASTPGEGCRFTVWMPRAAAASGEAPTDQAAAGPVAR